MKEYTLYLTYKCNWKCSYCIIDTHNQPEPQDIIEKIKTIENGSFVSISGGEPGLAEAETVRLSFELLIKKDCIIHLNTNGKFLNTYSQYLNDITSISYHVFADEVQPFFRRYPELEDKLDYALTVTDQMMDHLDTFFKINQDLKFCVFSADMRVNEDGAINNFLDKKNIIKIYTKYKDNINKECLQNCLENVLKFDRNKYYG